MSRVVKDIIASLPTHLADIGFSDSMLYRFTRLLKSFTPPVRHIDEAWRQRTPTVAKFPAGYEWNNTQEGSWLQVALLFRKQGDFITHVRPTCQTGKWDIPGQKLGVVIDTHPDTAYAVWIRIEYRNRPDGMGDPYRDSYGGCWGEPTVRMKPQPDRMVRVFRVPETEKTGRQMIVRGHFVEPVGWSPTMSEEWQLFASGALVYDAPDWTQMIYPEEGQWVKLHNELYTSRAVRFGRWLIEVRKPKTKGVWIGESVVITDLSGHSWCEFGRDNYLHLGSFETQAEILAVIRGALIALTGVPSGEKMTEKLSQS